MSGSESPNNTPFAAEWLGSTGRRRALGRLAGWGSLPLLGLGLGLGLSACDPSSMNPLSAQKLKFNGVDITGAKYARRLSLPDAQGRMRSLEEFRGRVVLVFFGFTQCPDVCPTAMAEIAEVRKRLGADAERVQGIFVTVDPERDTGQVLTDYTRAMDPTLVSLRGSVAQVQQAADEFKVFFNKVPSRDGKGYTMDHTAGLFVFDPEGKVRLFVRYGAGIDPLLADVKTLLRSA